MMDAHANAGWADRLGATTRYTLIVVAAILGIFSIGMVAGFSYAIYEDGQLPPKPLAYLVFAVIIGVAASVGWLLATLIRSLRPQAMSGFDRRYWKMWAVVAGLGMPIGIALAVIGLGGEGEGEGFKLILSNAPIAAPAAIAIAVTLTVLLGIAAVYYHRTVDDHEERAYLWGSTLAYIS